MTRDQVRQRGRPPCHPLRFCVRWQTSILRVNFKGLTLENETGDGAGEGHSFQHKLPRHARDLPEETPGSTRTRTHPPGLQPLRPGAALYLQLSWKRHLPSRKNGQGFRDLCVGYR